MIRLSKKQVLFLHSELIKETGGLSGIREEGLLDSALEAPFQSFNENDLYPSIQQKGARLGYGIIKNHAFADGNKRIGTHSLSLGFIEWTPEKLGTYNISVIVSDATGVTDTYSCEITIT